MSSYATLSSIAEDTPMVEKQQHSTNKKRNIWESPKLRTGLQPLTEINVQRLDSDELFEIMSQDRFSEMKADLWITEQREWIAKNGKCTDPNDFKNMNTLGTDEHGPVPSISSDESSQEDDVVNMKSKQTLDSDDETMSQDSFSEMKNKLRIIAQNKWIAKNGKCTDPNDFKNMNTLGRDEYEPIPSTSSDESSQEDGVVNKKSKQTSDSDDESMFRDTFNEMRAYMQNMEQNNWIAKNGKCTDPNDSKNMNTLERDEYKPIPSTSSDESSREDGVVNKKSKQTLDSDDETMSQDSFSEMKNKLRIIAQNKWIAKNGKCTDPNDFKNMNTLGRDEYEPIPSTSSDESSQEDGVVNKKSKQTSDSDDESMFRDTFNEMRAYMQNMEQNNWIAKNGKCTDPNDSKNMNTLERDEYKPIPSTSSDESSREDGVVNKKSKQTLDSDDETMSQDSFSEMKNKLRIIAQNKWIAKNGKCTDPNDFKNMNTLGRDEYEPIPSTSSDESSQEDGVVNKKSKKTSDSDDESMFRDTFNEMKDNLRNMEQNNWIAKNGKCTDPNDSKNMNTLERDEYEPIPSTSSDESSQEDGVVNKKSKQTLDSDDETMSQDSFSEMKNKLRIIAQNKWIAKNGKCTDPNDFKNMNTLERDEYEPIPSTSSDETSQEDGVVNKKSKQTSDSDDESMLRDTFNEMKDNLRNMEQNNWIAKNGKCTDPNDSKNMNTLERDEYEPIPSTSSDESSQEDGVVNKKSKQTLDSDDETMSQDSFSEMKNKLRIIAQNKWIAKNGKCADPNDSKNMNTLGRDEHEPVLSISSDESSQEDGVV